MILLERLILFPKSCDTQVDNCSLLQFGEMDLIAQGEEIWKY